MAVNLQIPQPCPQKWSDLRPLTTACRSCATCTRTVTDFTQKTDAEVLLFLQQHGRVCGRFRPDQLNRSLIGAKNIKRGGLTAIAAGLVTLLAAQQPVMQGQKAPVTNIDQFPVEGEQPPVENEKTTTDTLQTIAGQIFMENPDEEVLSASVVLMGTRYGAITGSAGKFSFDVPIDTLKKSGYVLRISYTGYVGQELNLSGLSSQEMQGLHGTFKEQSALLGEIVITLPHKYRWKRFFNRLF